MPAVTAKVKATVGHRTDATQYDMMVNATARGRMDGRQYDVMIAWRYQRAMALAHPTYSDKGDRR